MFRMYCILKDRTKPPTPEEVAFASAKQALDAKSKSEYIQRLETSTENIWKAFAVQEAKAAVCPHFHLMALS